MIRLWPMALMAHRVGQLTSAFRPLRRFRLGPLLRLACRVFHLASVCWRATVFEGATAARLEPGDGTVVLLPFRLRHSTNRVCAATTRPTNTALLGDGTESFGQPGAPGTKRYGSDGVPTPPSK